MSDKRTLYNEGLTLFGEGKHHEAIEKYNQIIEIDPDDAEIYMAISMSYQQLQDYEQALEAAKKACEMQPQEPLYYTNLSRCYVKLGMVPEAEDAMAKSKQLSGGY